MISNFSLLDPAPKPNRISDIDSIPEDEWDVVCYQLAELRKIYRALLETLAGVPVFESIPADELDEIIDDLNEMVTDELYIQEGIASCI